MTPLNDAVHDVTGIVFLVGAKSLTKGQDNMVSLDEFSYYKRLSELCNLPLMKAINQSTRQKLTGLMSLFKAPMKSVRVTCSFSALSMSTSTVDVAWNTIRFSLDLSNVYYESTVYA